MHDPSLASSLALYNTLSSNEALSHEHYIFSSAINTIRLSIKHVFEILNR